MRTLAWLAWKFLFSKKMLLSPSTIWAFIGLVIGVASLVVSMAVMSGFDETLKNSMTDVTGHVQVIKRSSQYLSSAGIEEKIRETTPDVVAMTPFSFLEAVAAKNGSVSGVVLQGLEPESFGKVLKFEQRLTSGTSDLKIQSDELPGAMIGKGLARKLNIAVGDTLSVVIPVADGYEASSFARKLGKVHVTGILDLGKNDYNERFIIVALNKTQEWGKLGDDFQGYFLKYSNAEIAQIRSVELSQHLGRSFLVRGWRDVNENLFEALKLERVVIFFVVFVIVIVASFNISSTLFVSVVQRYPDIALLKTLGLDAKKIKWLFSIQGLLLGFCGLILGYILGLIFCYLFIFLQTRFNLISGSVYKLDFIDFTVRFQDLLVISVATLLICFLATLAPARKGAELEPMEGLRHV